MNRAGAYPKEVREPLAMRLELYPSEGSFTPGQTLLGRFVAEAKGGDRIRAVEISVLWCTEGKGDEDMFVHYFRRVVVESEEDSQLSRPLEFDVVLPPSPLSYDGQILKIHWCARARVFPRKGNQVVLERRFHLRPRPAAELDETLGM